MQTSELNCLGIASPLGFWLLTSTDTHAVSLDYAGDAALSADVRCVPGTKLEKRLSCMLSRYFKGEPIDFSRVPIALPASAFLAGVMTALQAVPYGEVRSYQWLAVALGKPKAARAVGGALGRNPLPILVPCHRIISKNGSLGGFMRGAPVGTRLKEGLLGLEGALNSGLGIGLSMGSSIMGCEKDGSDVDAENRLPLLR